jgi:oligopeptidase A
MNYDVPECEGRSAAEAQSFPEANARLGEMETRLAELARGFAENVVAASAGWSKAISDESLLQGMEPSAKARAQRSAQTRGDGTGPWLLTLDRRSYEAAVDHLEDRKLRHDLYEAYVTRASDHGPQAGRFDNTPLVQEILALRHEAAVLRGHRNHAERVLAHAVLRGPDEVERYLLQKGAEGRARAQAELDAIWAYARAQGAPKGFSSWDLGYYAKRLRHERTGFDRAELRPYLPFPAVLIGAAALIERWLGIRVHPIAAESAPPHGGRYRLVDATETELGRLEIQLFAGPGAVEGARCEQAPGPDGLPRLCLRYDLEPVAADAPLLLSHVEVCELFRALGRGLHGLLCCATPATLEQRQAQQTLAEILGCFFERSAWHYPTFSSFARHHESGAPLPRESLDRLVSEAQLHGGLALSRVRELALFDLRVHRDFVPSAKATRLRAQVLDTFSQVRSEVCALRPPFWDRTANTCTALFVDGHDVRLWELAWAREVARELFVAAEAEHFSRDCARRLHETLWLPRTGSVLERVTRALGHAPAMLLG